MWKSEIEVMCDQAWCPILGICARFNPSKCTHSSEHTHFGSPSKSDDDAHAFNGETFDD